VQEPTGWTYRQNQSNLPLYLYEPAAPDKSVCGTACEKQWAPLLAPADEKPLGHWTILVRKDGRRQWAFEQHPVYTYRRDTPARTTGAQVGGAWYLMPHYRS
jgi:predicted lipoprotein with Yx(FWY)xxD motif